MEKPKVIGQVDVELREDVHRVIVRRLVDWGYLDAGDCIDEDESDDSRKLGAAGTRCSASEHE